MDKYPRDPLKEVVKDFYQWLLLSGWFWGFSVFAIGIRRFHAGFSSVLLALIGCVLIPAVLMFASFIVGNILGFIGTVLSNVFEALTTRGEKRWKSKAEEDFYRNERNKR